MLLTKLFCGGFICILMLAGCSTNKTAAGTETKNFSTADEQSIVTAMNKSADDWNRADLAAFMTIYDTNATFMTGKGPIGVAAMRDNYNKTFFVNGKPKQSLRFEEMNVTPLGQNYALLLGRFVLYGNNLPELSGRYSVVFVRTVAGWKMLHDHSS